MHLFRGKIHEDEEITFDIKKDVNPTICDDVKNIRNFREIINGLNLIIADPPYDKSDFEKYGCEPFNKVQVIRDLGKIMRAGSFLVRLDIRIPMYCKKSVETYWPSDGDNKVATDLSQITVTFSEKIDKNSVDTGSLSVFADNCPTLQICNDPDIQDVSVSSKSATFTINSNDRLSPDTNYIASISSSIQDQNGNFLDCFASKGVDDNCEWNFSTSGSTSNPTISINPTSGTVLSSVTVTGNGFAPSSTVVITFGGSTVATVIPTSSGGFTTTFIVP